MLDIDSGPIIDTYRSSFAAARMSVTTFALHPKTIEIGVENRKARGIAKSELASQV